MRATGYKPDPVGYKRTPFHHLAARLSASALPMIVSLEVFAPPCLDQGQTGTCTANALACAAVIAFACKGSPLGFVPSQAGPYRVSGELDRVQNPDGTWPKLEDNGREPNQVYRAYNEWGVYPMVPLPDRFSDADPATICSESQFGELEASSVNMYVGEYQIFSTGAQRVAEVKTALANGIPVTAAIAGGSYAFQTYTGGVMGPLNAELDHYVTIIGYETQPDGSTVFIIRNSWGLGWGENGNCRIDEACLDQLGDLVAADFRRAS